MCTFVCVLMCVRLYVLREKVVRACARACVRVCVRACVCICSNANAASAKAGIDNRHKAVCKTSMGGGPVKSQD